MSRILPLLAMLILLAGPVCAAPSDTPAQDDATANADQALDLVSGESYLALPEYDRQMYVAGLNDAYLWSYAGGFERMRWIATCVDGRSARQLSAMFSKWLDDNPERWHEPAAKLFPFAMFDFCRDED